MLGTSVPAEDAQRMGMVWQVLDDDKLMEEATSLARRMASGPTLSYAAIKQALNRSSTSTLDQQLEFEARTQRALNDTADFKEGIAAFLAKRPANFQGR
jgi:2-(1,2-epoxy-1,2-dihydrophenyl)acetyl-CoA isomerase